MNLVVGLSLPSLSELIVGTRLIGERFGDDAGESDDKSLSGTASLLKCLREGALRGCSARRHGKARN